MIALIVAYQYSHRSDVTRKKKAKSLTTAIKHPQLPLCRFPAMRTESGKLPIKDRNKTLHVTNNAMPRENVKNRNHPGASCCAGICALSNKRTKSPGAHFECVQTSSGVHKTRRNSDIHATMDRNSAL